MAISDWHKLVREEFGVELFDCIAKFSERQWLREVLTRMDQQEQSHATLLDYGRCDRKKIRELDAELSRQIVALMPKLQPADVTRLMERYETKTRAVAS